jgi:hypothetical protein
MRGSYPLAPATTLSEAVVSDWLAVAMPQAALLLDALAPNCVVLTDTPYDGAVGAFARSLADGLRTSRAGQFGVYFLDPEMAGLRTLDHGHLDEASAIAWSTAFLAGLEPIGRQCGVW